MRDNSLFKRYEILVAGAVLSTHVIAGEEGFRPRDVRFYVELFSNWVEFAIGSGVLQVENTQVCRYLDDLLREGYARKRTLKGRVTFCLTRTGLLEMISRVILPERIQPFELFCFQIYLANSYGKLARAEIERQGKQFPTALRIEVDELLDVSKLCSRRQSAIEMEILKLEARAKDGIDSGKLAKLLFQQGRPLAEVIEKIKENHPYHMSSQKSLAELVMILPQEIQEWELAEGAAQRSELIWLPALNALKNELASLSKLQSQIKKHKVG